MSSSITKFNFGLLLLLVISAQRYEASVAMDTESTSSSSSPVTVSAGVSNPEMTILTANNTGSVTESSDSTTSGTSPEQSSSSVVTETPGSSATTATASPSAATTNETLASQQTTNSTNAPPAAESNGSSPSNTADAHGSNTTVSNSTATSYSTTESTWAAVNESTTELTGTTVNGGTAGSSNTTATESITGSSSTATSYGATESTRGAFNDSTTGSSNTTATESITESSSTATSHSTTEPPSTAVNVSTTESINTTATESRAGSNSTTVGSNTTVNVSGTQQATTGGETSPSITDTDANNSSIAEVTPTPTPATTASTCAVACGPAGCRNSTTGSCYCTGCSINQVCKNSSDGFTCECSPGYYNKSNTCTDINECRTNAHNCTQPGSTCKNVDGSYTCDCDAEYITAGSGGCSRLMLRKAQGKTDGVFITAYSDPGSQDYRKMATSLGDRMMLLLNGTEVNQMKIVRLWNGSIGFDAVFSVSEALAFSQVVHELSPLNFTAFNETDLSEQDLCVFNLCDPATSQCVPIAPYKTYECICKEGLGQIPNDRYRCQSGPCPADRCKNGGTCAVDKSHTVICSCPDGFGGRDCEKEVIGATVERIYLGLAIGLGSLAIFLILALIVVCCTEKRRSFKAERKDSPYIDDVTIDSYMPSLPRPKLKPGIFQQNVELSDQPRLVSASENKRKQNGAVAENPAFIPDADYDLDANRKEMMRDARQEANRESRLEGKRSSFVYF